MKAIANQKMSLRSISQAEAEVGRQRRWWRRWWAGREKEVEKLNAFSFVPTDSQKQLANDWDADDDEEPEAQPLAAAVAVAGAGGL